jgi:hypothetical protein
MTLWYLVGKNRIGSNTNMVESKLQGVKKLADCSRRIGLACGNLWASKETKRAMLME